MNPQSTFLAQATALLGDVGQQRGAMAAFTVPGQPTPVSYAARRLRGELAVAERGLETLIGRASAGANLRETRREYQRISEGCLKLFGECLAVTVAPALRPLSNGACDVVEKLLRGLGEMVGVRWQDLTTLSDAEFFGTASQVIRLRYPSSTIWDFPVAVHEFGHLVGPKCPAPDRRLNEYQNFLNERELGSESCLKEYFADLFATFVLGPAFVNTCLLYRFDPSSEETESHPSDRQRAVGILAGLALLAEDSKPDSAAILRTIHKTRAAEWGEAVKASGADLVEDAFAGMLQGCLRTLWEAMKDWCGEAELNDIHVAFQLRPGAIPPDEARIRDVLNAAWLLRLETQGDLLAPADRRAHGLAMSTIDSWAKIYVWEYRNESCCRSTGTEAEHLRYAAAVRAGEFGCAEFFRRVNQGTEYASV